MLMPIVTLQEAQAGLPDLIEQLQAGEHLIITREGVPIARLLAESRPPRKRRTAGSAKGLLTIVTEDEEHLADFKDYMG